MKKVAALVAAMAVAAVALMAGCSSPAGIVVGQEAEGSPSFELKNETGQAITAIAVDPAGADAFKALAQTGEIAADGTATVYVPADAAENASVKVTFADGLSCEMYGVNLADVKDAALKMDGATAYMAYTSIASGSAVDTKGAQPTAADDEAEQKAAEEEKAAKEAEEKAAKEAEEEKAAKKKAADEKKAAEEAEAKAKAEAAEAEAAEKAAAEEKAAQKAADEKAAKKAAEEKAAKKAAEEKRAAEKKKAAEEKKAAEKKKAAEEKKKKAEEKKKKAEASTGNQKQENCDDFEL